MNLGKLVLEQDILEAINPLLGKLEEAGVRNVDVSLGDNVGVHIWTNDDDAKARQRALTPCDIQMAADNISEITEKLFPLPASPDNVPAIDEELRRALTRLFANVGGLLLGMAVNNFERTRLVSALIRAAGLTLKK